MAGGRVHSDLMVIPSDLITETERPILHSIPVLSSSSEFEERQTTPPTSSRKSPTSPRCLKVRVLTWNMHDSLPKGNLEELFGKVPLYNTASPIPKVKEFPYLPKDANHPYHLIVVAGQECPTPSGIPMGLTAGFKILDKDRDKSKEFDKEHYKQNGKKEKIVSDENPFGNPPPDDPDYPLSGWTSMVEDYLCHNGGSARTALPSTADVGFPMPLSRRKSSKEPRKGPYQLLIKERLMGIYMAIYVHRDLKPLVRGMSKSAVAAGLIGGRVGNKGGVGISLNISGTTFLFLNAHLAAHEGKMNHRLANLTKIRNELSVEDFLAGNDPRKVTEDLTDRFDFTFLCGDLNFRLDISRLHADWLISRQDYTQAFQFDQLNNLMKEGKFIPGFNEASINFPPTFKYDVLRPSKKARSFNSKEVLVGEAFESRIEAEGEDAEVDTCEEDRLSVGSSTVTSIPSRSNLESEAGPSLLTPTGSSINQVPSNSTSKPKHTWISLLSPSFASSQNKLFKTRGPTTWNQPSPVEVPPSPLKFAFDSKPSKNGRKKHILRPPPIILINSNDKDAHSPSNFAFPNKGVYDSSHKKRVPSWCDRILWKTTIQPEVLVIDEPSTPGQRKERPMNRVGNFLISAFRSPPPRNFLDSDLPSTEPNTSDGNKLQFTERPQRANTSFSPPSTAPFNLLHPPRSSTNPDTPGKPSSERAQSATQSFWRFLPAFLSPTHNQGLNTSESSPPSSQTRPVKGEVVCLSYDTLDDHGMHRLEGRSDHRPVIGTYAIYI